MVHSTIKGPILPVLMDWLKTASSRGSCCVCVCVHCACDCVSVCMWTVYAVCMCVYMNTTSENTKGSPRSYASHPLCRKHFGVCVWCVMMCCALCMHTYFTQLAALSPTNTIGACRAVWVPGQDLATPHLMRNCGSVLHYTVCCIRSFVRA